MEQSKTKEVSVDKNMSIDGKAVHIGYRLCVNDVALPIVKFENTPDALEFMTIDWKLRMRLANAGGFRTSRNQRAEFDRRSEVNSMWNIAVKRIREQIHMSRGKRGEFTRKIDRDGKALVFVYNNFNNTW